MHVLLSCFGKLIIWIEAACAQIYWAQYTLKEKRSMKACSNKSRGPHRQEAWKSPLSILTRKSLKRLNNPQLFWNLWERKTQDKPWPPRDRKVTKGSQVYWSRVSQEEHTFFSSSHGTFTNRDHTLGHENPTRIEKSRNLTMYALTPLWN